MSYSFDYDAFDRPGAIGLPGEVVVELEYDGLAPTRTATPPVTCAPPLVQRPVTRTQICRGAVRGLYIETTTLRENADNYRALPQDFDMP